MPGLVWDIQIAVPAVEYHPAFTITGFSDVAQAHEIDSEPNSRELDISEASFAGSNSSSAPELTIFPTSTVV